MWALTCSPEIDLGSVPPPAIRAKRAEKEVQAGIGDQARMGVERGSAAGSAGPETIPKPMGRVTRALFFRHFNKLPERNLCDQWVAMAS